MNRREAAARTTSLPPSTETAASGGFEAEGRTAAMHRSIGRAVFEQRLLPGTRLPEDQIGGLFGASRTLVRAALQRLAHDGIVTMSRNRGAFVTSPTIEDARHVFEARRIVEGVVAVRAAESIGADDIEALDDMLARGRRAVEAGDRGTAIRLSGEFHIGIGASARQPVLRGFLVELVSRSSLVIALYGRGYGSACADEEHCALLDALRRRDGPAAGRLMAAHLDHIEADLDLAPRPLRTVSLAEVLALEAEVRA